MGVHERAGQDGGCATCRLDDSGAVRRAENHGSTPFKPRRPNLRRRVAEVETLNLGATALPYTVVRAGVGCVHFPLLLSNGKPPASAGKIYTVTGDRM